jgi:folylpolyglutamate synthase/dihydropteroate synthase
MRAIRKRVASRQAHLHVLDEQAERRVWHESLSDMADYQQHNWLLAFATYRYLEKRDELEHLTREVLLKTQSVWIPGRMDVKEVGDKTVIMDGAHNSQKMTAFISSFQRLYPDTKPAVLLSLKDTKDYGDLIPLLRPFASRIIITAFEVPQDVLARSLDPETLAGAFREAGNPPKVTVIPEAHEAYKALLAAPEQVGVVTGSFYLLNQIRNN